MLIASPTKSGRLSPSSFTHRDSLTGLLGGAGRAGGGLQLAQTQHPGGQLALPSLHASSAATIHQPPAWPGSLSLLRCMRYLRSTHTPQPASACHLAAPGRSPELHAVLVLPGLTQVAFHHQHPPFWVLPAARHTGRWQHTRLAAAAAAAGAATHAMLCSAGLVGKIMSQGWRAAS